MDTIVSRSLGLRWWPRPDGGEYEGTTAEDSEGRSYRHTKLMAAAWTVWMRNQARRQGFFYWASLFGGTDQAMSVPYGIDPTAQVFTPASLPYNVVRSATLTLTAKVAKNRPLPQFLPVDGDNRVKKRVRLLNKFVQGIFHRHKVYKRTYQATRNASLYGTGHILCGRDGRKLVYDVIYPWELYVDPVDSRYGEPRSLYLIRYLDRDIMKVRFPEHEDAIETAPVLDEAFYPIQDVFSVATRCTVVEAWHLPSGHGAKDGRHTMCLLDTTLLDEPWERDHYPIAELHKEIPLVGSWGLGLGDGMSAFQDEINVMSERVQYAHRIVGGQVWLVPDGGGVLDTDFNDEIGVVVRYQGGPDQRPVATNPEPLHPATYGYFKDLPPAAYQFEGISTMSAQSVRPPGVTAALALQTLDDIETDRFIQFERNHEEFHADIARLSLENVRDIAEEFGDFRVFSANKGRGQEILWKRDVDLDEDSYVVQEQVQSILPKEPAQKLQRVIELSAQQIFDRQQVLSLMGTPDTDAEERRLLAPREAVESQLAWILEADDPTSPDAYMPPSKFADMSYALSRAQQEYNLLQSDALDRGTIYRLDIRARLANLARYAQACGDLVNEAQQQAQLQAALAQAAPGATAGGAPIMPIRPQAVPSAVGPLSNLAAPGSPDVVRQSMSQQPQAPPPAPQG